MNFEPKKPAAEEVKAFRNLHGCSFAEARQVLRDREERRALAALRSEGTTDQKADWLLDRYAERFLRED